MTTDNIKQWEERFDERFVKYATGSGEHFRWGKKPPEIKQFIQSEIDQAIKERDEEIVKIAESHYIDTIPEAEGTDVTDYLIGANETVKSIINLIKSNK
jgi:hypothetical protein